MRGSQHIKQACNQAQSIFVPFVEFGHPTIKKSIGAIKALAKMGATIIEVGVPCTNPHLDGDVITNANRIALDNGADLLQCIRAIRQLRQEGVKTPIMLMSYQDVFPKRKFDDIVAACKVSGIDGFLIPDLDSKNRSLYKHICHEHGLSLTDFITANHSETEIQRIMKEATGFVYGISTDGKTGTGSSRATGLNQMVKNVRKHGDLPIALGFGMSTTQHAKEFSPVADGIIVGSVLVKKLDGSMKQAMNHATDMHKSLL